MPLRARVPRVSIAHRRTQQPDGRRHHCGPEARRLPPSVTSGGWGKHCRLSSHILRTSNSKVHPGASRNKSETWRYYNTGECYAYHYLQFIITSTPGWHGLKEHRFHIQQTSSESLPTINDRLIPPYLFSYLVFLFHTLPFLFLF